MCGRYEAGQKQKIAEAFHVSVKLDDVYFGQGVECVPGSVQPDIYMKDGERKIGEMRWGFKLPDRLLFNARSDTVATSPFWKERPLDSRGEVGLIATPRGISRKKPPSSRMAVFKRSCISAETITPCAEPMLTPT